MYQPFDGHRYLDVSEVAAWCHAAAAAFPRWARCTHIGSTAGGRPIVLLTLTDHDDGSQTPRPALWLDGGTHAAELAGTMGAVFAASRWLGALHLGDPEVTRWFGRNAVHIAPCICPDGMQAMMDGAPFLRSTLRPGPPGSVRTGLDARDMDGDGAVRWMRWRHPAGPFVDAEGSPLAMRRRRIDDDPSDAWVLCSEGAFLHWDGAQWRDASRQFALDLNRNFPGNWQPFEMFGMNGGAFPLSEPESRAVVDAVAARPGIAAAVTNHTFTGALLTQPYRKPSPLPASDIELMAILAEDAVRDTGYRAIRVHPDFVYDADKPIVGVWADTMTTLFGFPAYTLEMWDPFAHCGVTIDKPAEFFRQPPAEVVAAMFTTFADDPSTRPWTPFEHPQLGSVEVGGIDRLHTIRNPPVALLAAECQRAFVVADRVRRSLPELRVELAATRMGPDLHEVSATLTNVGFLDTAGLQRATQLAAHPGIGLEVELDGCALISGQLAVQVPHLEGWGSLAVGASRQPLGGGLGSRGPRAVERWVVRGAGIVSVRWTAPRAGCGVASLELSTP